MQGCELRLMDWIKASSQKATSKARRAGIGERRYGADLGPANMFNRQFGG